MSDWTSDFLTVPVKAFFPHGQLIGLQIGANADTEQYCPGFLRYATMAPCPPILCPVIDCLLGKTGREAFTRAGS